MPWMTPLKITMVLKTSNASRSLYQQMTTSRTRADMHCLGEGGQLQKAQDAVPHGESICFSTVKIDEVDARLLAGSSCMNLTFFCLATVCAGASSLPDPLYGLCKTDIIGFKLIESYSHGYSSYP